MSAVSVERVRKCFGTYAALDGVTFDISAGSVVALLGRNGAGKTTMTEILAGFLAPTSGTVRVLGNDPRRAGRTWRAQVGLVLQSTSLDLQLTVAEVLAAYRSAYPVAMTVPDVLRTIDLEGDARTRIGALSGGQRRRVDLGLGIIGRPRLLFLDEPTTGLDPLARRGVWDVVDELATAGNTVLLTTHYLDEAQQLADRVIVLDEGRVVADASPDDLRRQAAAPTIRLPRPHVSAVADLPRPLVSRIVPDPHELVLSSPDVADDLRALLDWAGRHRIDLSGIQVGPPSLEDAYLALTGEPAQLAKEPIHD